MRFVLCDDDTMVRSLIETIISRQGHDIVGVAETTVDGANLVRAGRPDVLLIDLSLGINTDFDVIETAGDVGARTIVFSHNADHTILDRYEPRPIVIVKPDLAALERCIEQLAIGVVVPGIERPAEPTDRRRRPVRSASGPVPTGIGDAGAFYEALNNAVGGDALVSIELGVSGPSTWEDAGARIGAQIRGTDRLLASPSSVRVFLAGGESDGASSLLGRLERSGGVPPEWVIRSVVVGEGEDPADAFARLKSSP